MKWHDFISEPLAGEYSEEQNCREIISVTSAFKTFSIKSKTNVYRYFLNVEADCLKHILDTIESCKFTKFVSYNIGNQSVEPFIYYDDESYINGTSKNGIHYTFKIYSIDKSIKEKIIKKYNSILNMEEALK